MAIRLDILKDRKNADAYRKFSYADLRLDIDLNSHIPSTPVGISKNAVDLKLSYDENAIFNSIKNIFNTKKGQKILNPTFGLDLEMFLFDNISRENADLIGKTIYEENPLNGLVRSQVSQTTNQACLIFRVVIFPLLNDVLPPGRLRILGNYTQFFFPFFRFATSSSRVPAELQV